MMPRQQMDELVRRSYATAINAQHDNTGARIEIHLSKTLVDDLKARIRAEGEDRPTVAPAWLWGFPAVQHDDWFETRIEIHAITTVR